MLLRISLGIAILAAAGALYFSQFQVAPRIATLTADLASAQEAASTAQQGERTAKAETEKAKSELTVAKTELKDKSDQLEEAKGKYAEQLERGNKMDADLKKVTSERNESQQQLAAWQATGLTPDRINTLRGELAKVGRERDAFAAESKLLARVKDKLATRLSLYEDQAPKDPEMPSGLKGSILAVDTKYEFVVLDIGGNQGAVPQGKFLVSRNGKFVGAVRVTRVEPTRSIANIIPELQQTNLEEGDQVIY